MGIPVGARGSAEAIVTSEDTATALGSGAVDVLATPRALALLEEATCDALRGHLPASHTSVGTAVDIRHRRPTPIGARVVASAEVVAVDGSSVVFEVSARHEAGERVVERIVTGTITRSIVERAVFGAD